MDLLNRLPIVKVRQTFPSSKFCAIWWQKIESLKSKYGSTTHIKYKETSVDVLLSKNQALCEYYTW